MALEIEQLIQIVKQHGATHVVELDPSLLVGHQCYRDSCATNACGNYGKYWTCPPGVGELELITQELRGFPKGIVLQNVTEVEGSWDFEGMGKAAALHNNMVREVASQLRTEYPDTRIKALGNGGCGLCENCTYPDSPCLYPERAVPSISGFGIDAKTMLESHGLRYINGQNTVSFVGLILIDG